MYLNEFSVRVLGGKEVSGGYVEMEHGAKYRLSLHNGRDARCDAYIEVDGKHVGTWRLAARQSITLERPAHDPGQFTFYAVGTIEATQAKLQEGDPNLGLVRVTFTPEGGARPLTVTPHYPPPSLPYHTGPDRWPHPWPWRPTYISVGGSATDAASGSMPIMASCSAQSHSAGGTGLSGHSAQEFGSAYAIEYDLSQQTVIHLRLVAGHAEGGVRPLTAFSTPVPPAVR